MARNGRPLAMTAEDRKAAIFSAAEMLLGERGDDKVTMSDIAAAAGMSKRTLYTVFGDKEELLRSLIASSYIWPENAFDGAASDGVELLRLRLRVIANHVLSDRHINLCRIAIGERNGMSGLTESFVEMGIGKSRASLIETIASIPPDRFIVDLLPQILAPMLFGGACGYNLMNALLTGKKPEMSDVYVKIDEIVDHCFTVLPGTACLRA
jgi:TetR/AcrR family transcriptional regulator, mexJK operon transcriptional repressor